MTKDEILEYFKDINHAYNDCTRYDTLKRMLDELQEPCTDAISRQAAIDELYKMLHDCFGADDEELDAVITTLNALPPVTPAEKVGQWIKKEHEICFTCNRCWVTNANGTKYNYCPNCGAKMEVEE